MNKYVSVRIAAVGLMMLSAASGQTNRQAAAPAGPQMLDLSKIYRQWFITPTKTNRDFGVLVGQQTYDGLPFHIEGRGYVYGRRQAQAERTAEAAPDFLGIRVGRTFDELHLLHGTRYLDVQGETIAFIRLNYADGSQHKFPIRYGVHVCDWLWMGPEEKELLTDPNSKVIFRSPPGSSQFHSTARMFKTMLRNPHPAKVVSTLDVISARHLAAYDLVAATVANSDPTRAVTPHVSSQELEQTFDTKITIRVLDEISGKPIAGALVEPSLRVYYHYVVAPPAYTDTNGTMVIRYPREHTDEASAFVGKAGYQSAGSGWKREGIPTEFNFRLNPIESAASEIPKPQ